MSPLSAPVVLRAFCTAAGHDFLPTSGSQHREHLATVQYSLVPLRSSPPSRPQMPAVHLTAAPYSLRYNYARLSVHCWRLPVLTCVVSRLTRADSPLWLLASEQMYWTCLKANFVRLQERFKGASEGASRSLREFCLPSQASPFQASSKPSPSQSQDRVQPPSKPSSIRQSCDMLVLLHGEGVGRLPTALNISPARGARGSFI